MDPLVLSIGQDVIRVNVSNSKNDNVAFDMKFLKSLTVAQLKCKLEIITGGSAATMQLVVYNADHLVARLDNDAACLGALPIEEGMRIHVIDNFTWITDENIEKFELPDEQYDAKQDSIRNFLRKNRLGKYNEEEQCLKEEKQRVAHQMELQRAELCTVGARCQVQVPGNPTRRGTIKYKGPIDGKKGIFIGVLYDEPLGKNDGSFNGKSYFTCQPNYGAFVSAMAVEVGDFPPEVIEIDDEI